MSLRWLPGCLFAIASLYLCRVAALACLSGFVVVLAPVLAPWWCHCCHCGSVILLTKQPRRRVRDLQPQCLPVILARSSCSPPWRPRRARPGCRLLALLGTRSSGSGCASSLRMLGGAGELARAEISCAHAVVRGDGEVGWSVMAPNGEAAGGLELVQGGKDA
ncbi:hypothetical protein BDZ97DRAFT_1772088 [Flammula alnicola]|nr:hypothetical protein BDZ97DRAFT_1772088 [Flammula alnicola]